jgi:hypothetical protein
MTPSSDGRDLEACMKKVGKPRFRIERLADAAQIETEFSNVHGSPLQGERLGTITSERGVSQ